MLQKLWLGAFLLGTPQRRGVLGTRLFKMAPSLLCPSLTLVIYELSIPWPSAFVSSLALSLLPGCLLPKPIACAARQNGPSWELGEADWLLGISLKVTVADSCGEKMCPSPSVPTLLEGHFSGQH